MMKRLPFPFEALPYPKAPQSVKKILPVRWDKTKECGPRSAVP